MSPAETVPPSTDRSIRILEAACRVIIREGAHGLRMARVAEEAHVSKEPLDGRALPLSRTCRHAPEPRPRNSGPNTIAPVHEKRIEIRWRDVDAFRHVNNAVYATYLEECRDELAELVLEGVGDPWDFVLARVAINYRRELIQADDIVVVGCGVDRVGNSSVTLREEIRTLGGELAAEAEAVIVARDPASGRSRALTEAERDAFERARTLI